MGMGWVVESPSGRRSQNIMSEVHIIIIIIRCTLSQHHNDLVSGGVVEARRRFDVEDVLIVA